MMQRRIQGQLLEVTVVGCNKLKDTEWISRQDPYVCLEYGSTKFRTRTCTDGHRNPTFQEKFVFTLIEGLREINVAVWNSNTLSSDDFIGSGKVQLLKVLSQGYSDTTWPLQTKSGRNAGEVRFIMYYAKANKPDNVYNPVASYAPPPSTPLQRTQSTHQMCPYSAPPPPPPPPSYPLQPFYSPPATVVYPIAPCYPSVAYPPAPYHHPHSEPLSFSTYPPPPYPSSSIKSYYPPVVYPEYYPPHF